MALQGFDKDYYLQAKLDALVASGETEWVGKDAAFLEAVLVNVYGLTPEDHYSQYGYAEGLAPNACFNAAEYTLAKATQLFNAGLYMTVEDAQADYEAKWPGDDYQHYLQYGSAEGVNPSNAFDESSYLDSKLAALQADPDTSVEWADKTADDVQAAFTAAGLTVLGHYIAYGQDEGIAVTPVPADEQVNTSDLGVVGETFILTTGLDNVVGTANDDTIIGLSDGSDNTLTLGDVINGGAGTDTLKITSDQANLNLSIADVSNVENLLVNAAGGNFDTLNAANVAYDTLTVDMLDNIDAGLTISNVDSQTAVVFQNIVGNGSSSTVDFKVDTTSTTATISDTVQNIDTTNAFFDIEFNHEFTAATTINSTFNITNVQDPDYDGSYDNIYQNIITGAENSVINAEINITNFDVEDYYVEVNIDQNSGTTVNAVVNMTDVDSVEFNFDTEDSVTGTAGSSDNITYNISNLENTGGYMYLDSNGMESITVNVNGDSVIEDIDDTSIQGDLQTLDIVANADLTSVNIYLNDSTSTEITVIGTGNVDLGDVSVGDGDAIDTVTVDASALTGDFTMIDNDGNINTIESGTGDDNITVAAFTTEVTTNDGDDTVDTAGLDFGHADAETVDGGDGNDTVAIIDATLADAEYMANVVNFETLEIAGATAIGIAGTATAYDMDVMGFTDVKLTNTAIAANTVIENVAAGALFTMTNTDNITPLTAGGILTYSLEDASAADDEVALVMHTVDTAKTADNVAIAASTSAAIIIEQDADSEGVETIALTSNATTASVADDDNDAWTSSDYTNSLSLDAADMTDLVIDGNAQAAVIFTDATALTFVDASGNEAGVAVDASAGGIVAGVTFKGSEAADTYTATANGDLVQANGGADDILLGAGDDTVRYAVASDSQLTLKDTSDPADEVADVASGYDSIAGFNAVGTDLIELSSLLNLATGDARADMLQKGEITTAAVDGTWTPAEIEAFIGDGVDFFDTGVVDRATAFAFTDDVDETLPALGTTGQGFLFVDANNDGNFTQADDMVIALSGVESLLITDITFG